MRHDPIDRILKPIDSFIHNQSAAGLVLLISTAVAVVLANSPWSHDYQAIWEHTISLQVAGFALERTVHHLINDGLMAVFFFLVALELKREFIGGELSEPRNALLPIAASIGGMAAPALIYLAINEFSGPATAGWGIPMGTDTAFVLGLLALLGKRVPPALKVFFITVSVADDIGSVTVIALFYTSDIEMQKLLLGGIFLVALIAMNVLGVRNVIAYGVVGIAGVWLAFLLSGVHATVAGVLAALTIPARTKIQEHTYVVRLRELADEFERTESSPHAIITSEQQHLIRKIRRMSDHAETPLQRLEQALHPWVVYVVMPLFALANAGIELPASVGDVLSSPITLGVLLGLVLGKPIGIVGMAFLVSKLGWGRLGQGLTWSHVVGIGVMSGLGFTMSVFINELAFDDLAMQYTAKLGILFASLIAGPLGFVLLRRVSASASEAPPRAIVSR